MRVKPTLAALFLAGTLAAGLVTLGGSLLSQGIRPAGSAAETP